MINIIALFFTKDFSSEYEPTHLLLGASIGIIAVVILTKNNQQEKSEMRKNKDYPHRIAVNTTICKYCGQPQCDLCIKEHLTYHVSNNDQKIRWEDME